jgi:hypothetical protein
MMDKGIYIQRSNNGRIQHVQLLDSAGNSRPIDPGVYVACGLRPLIEELPDVSEYAAYSPPAVHGQTGGK